MASRRLHIVLLKPLLWNLKMELLFFPVLLSGSRNALVVSLLEDVKALSERLVGGQPEDVEALVLQLLERSNRRKLCLVRFNQNFGLLPLITTHRDLFFFLNSDNRFLNGTITFLGKLILYRGSFS